MKRDQFANRYIIKLSSSVLMALCNIAIQILLPRAISVEEYGFYSYNLNVFTSVVVMSNMSASSALVAKYSKKSEDIGYVKFYFGFYSLIAVILTAGLSGLFSVTEIRKSFGGQTFLVVLLGLESTLLVKLMADVISLYDSAAISRFPAVIQVLQRLFLCIFVLVTYFLGCLNLIYFYIGQISIFIIIIAILIKYFFKDFYTYVKEPVIRKAVVYLKEYYQFCRPLVFAGIVSQIIIIVMNYTLMRYSGATEQAMFGAAWQLNTLVGYVFSPYAELMKREFAVVSNDKDALKHRFWQSIKTIIWLSSYFSVFIGMFAGWILPLLYGDKYVGATLVTQMIMVYTIFQACGQMCGSYMIAIEDTKGYAVLSVIGQIASAVFILLFQVPNFIFSEGLGSVGIGLAYLCSNYISVIVMMIYLVKKSKDSQIRMHGIYIVAILSCGLTAYFIRIVMQPLFIGKGVILNALGIATSGVVYSIIIGLELYLFPNFIGINRETIKRMIGKVASKWKRR